MHDWSRLNYNTHSRKQDRLQMTHATDVGYELQRTVLVADRDGAPLGAPAQNLRTAQGVWSARNRLWLVRAKAAGRVRCGQKTSNLQQVADDLCFAKVRQEYEAAWPLACLAAIG